MSCKHSNTSSVTLRLPGVRQPQHDEQQPGQQRAAAGNQPQPKQHCRRQPRESSHNRRSFTHAERSCHTLARSIALF